MRISFVKTAFIILTLVLCLFLMPSMLQWEVGGVQVNTGGVHVGSDVIIATIEPHLGAGWLFSSLETIQAALQDLPWIEQVELFRVFPDRIVVNITERDPVARMADKALVSQKGVLFYPEDYALWQDLPFLDVDRGDAKLAFSALQTVRQIGLGEGNHAYPVQSVRFNVVNGWDIRFSNALLVRLGRGDFNHLYTRFCAYYPLILHGNRYVVPHKIDMRYAHGAAVS